MDNLAVSEYLAGIDRISFADIIDALRRREGENLFFSEDSGIVFRHKSGLHYVAAFGDSPEVFSYMPEDAFICAHGEKAYNYAVSNLGYKAVEPTYLFVYTGDAFPLEDASIKTLDSSFVPFVMEHYDVSSEEDVALAAAAGHLFGAFSPSGELMAFTGFHSEGSMGMLTVFPEYRRMGLGSKMEKMLINTALREGRTAFCNVFISNEASIRLQGKLGLERAALLSWWTWKE